MHSLKKLSTLVCLLLFSSSTLSTKVGYKLRGTYKTTNPAFLDFENGRGKDLLIHSSFGPLSSGKVWVTPSISQYVKENRIEDIKPVEIASGFQWPNDVKLVPDEVFGTSANYFVVPDGFLVPFHDDGSIQIVTTDINDITKKTG